MERQQNHYRTVLETAHQSAEDNKPTSPIPAWALPKNPRTANYFITDNIAKYYGTNKSKNRKL